MEPLCTHLKISHERIKEWHGELGARLNAEEFAPRHLRNGLLSGLTFLVGLSLMLALRGWGNIVAAAFMGLLAQNIAWGAAEAVWVLRLCLKEKKGALCSMKSALYLGVAASYSSGLIIGVLLFILIINPCLSLLITPFYMKFSKTQRYRGRSRLKRFLFGFRAIGDKNITHVHEYMWTLASKNEKFVRRTIKKSQSKQLVSQYLYEWLWESVSEPSTLKKDLIHNYFELIEAVSIDWEYTPIKGLPPLLEWSKIWLNYGTWSAEERAKNERLLAQLNVEEEARIIEQSCGKKGPLIQKKARAL